MSFSRITIPRGELYKKVWDRPVSVIAKEYGISDVGLAKMCRRLHVPLPGVGYWAKVQHGQPVVQLPLPPPPPDIPLEVAITSFKEDPDPVQLKKGNEMLDAEALEANEVRVPDVLVDPHPAVARSLKAMRKARPDEDGIVDASEHGRLPVSVSPAQLDRAMRIMDALLRAFEARGYPFTVGPVNVMGLQVVVVGEPLGFFLTEHLNPSLRPLTPKQQKEKELYQSRNRPEYDYAPSGKLVLKVHATLFDRTRCRWSDHANRPLERSLNSVLAGMVKVAVAVRAARLERERSEREQIDRERRRKVLMAAQERERRLLARLDADVAGWHKAQQIRAYVQGLRTFALEVKGKIDPGSDVERWMAWAMIQADRFDPMVKSPPSVLDEPLP